ncbi:hypothetical protein SKAU_G00031730 [Synaphobranchus kaupii]|uniref:Uncharacterized protein n=1 Tax=Synaphobranchus kaupii TaxID=118154 RepID=A0A9Q1JF67_SYNKA|nr:hypothetical protein SKAU_G00031730 [Synaphobranchus kaupii]
MSVPHSFLTKRPVLLCLFLSNGCRTGPGFTQRLTAGISFNENRSDLQKSTGSLTCRTTRPTPVRGSECEVAGLLPCHFSLDASARLHAGNGGSSIWHWAAGEQ